MKWRADARVLLASLDFQIEIKTGLIDPFDQRPLVSMAPKGLGTKGKGAAVAAAGAKKRKFDKADFTLNWSDEDVESGGSSGEEQSGDEEDDSVDQRETAEEKRRRLAKEYLASMADGSSSEGESEDDENNKDSTNIAGKSQVISDRLRRERLESKGKYFRSFSRAVQTNSEKVENMPRNTMGGHDLSITCVSLSADEKNVFSGSKDNSIIKWDVETQQKQIIKPKWKRETHFEKQASEGEILSLATTSDGRYIVSGGRDSKLRVFDARMGNAEVKVLPGHRDAVTSLAIRRDSYSLFSGSLDRCVKHWDLSEMGYLETMFGHQDGVNAMDCWNKEKPISASVDRTWRSWKIIDESHLVFRGHKSSVDAVQLLTEESFISGGQDGMLCLWKDTQKKPIASVLNAHGMESSGNPNWVSSIASIKMSDMAASGSNDGYVRIWNANALNRSLEQVAAVKVEGFVNSLALSSRLVVAGTGREHRLGRWWCMKGNKNKVVVMRLPEEVTNPESEDEESSEEGEEGSGNENSSSEGEGESEGSESYGEDESVES